VRFNKKLFFLFLSIYSLLNISIQGQSFAFDKNGSTKTELKKYFFQATTTQSIQRNDIKEKTRAKTYAPEILFYAAPLVTRLFFTPISQDTSFLILSEADSFSISNRPRAPPV